MEPTGDHPDPGADPVPDRDASSASIPVHLGIIMVVNMEIGMVTPPVGLNLFVTSGITGMPVTQVVRAAAAVARWCCSRCSCS